VKTSAIVASPAIRAAVGYGVAGAGFALGNILLARYLSQSDFAWVALLFAFSQLALGLGPLGAETIVNRVPPDADRYLAGRVTLSALPIALAIATFAYLAYELPLVILPILFLICWMIALNAVVAALFQSRQRFAKAMWLSQVHNVLVAVVALVATYIVPMSVVAICLCLALGYVVTVTIGAAQLGLAPSPPGTVPGRKLPWAEGLAIVALNVAVIVMIQSERLLIPKVLDLSALSVFAVLAAFAGSPFRVLQMGVGLTMLPRLRAASGQGEIRGILMNEAVTIGSFVVVAWIAVWLVFPLVTELLLEGKYSISRSLLLAALFAGTAKVLSSFVTSMVWAFGTKKDLNRLNIGTWLALAVAVVASFVLARFGLTGVILGVTLGWLTQATLAVGICRHYL
jgi:hypothetical protein